MSANRKLAKRFRPSFETLEARGMMSVTSVTLNEGVLKVELDGANDNVKISESSFQFDNATLVASSAAPTTTLASSSPTLFASRDVGSALLRTITVTDLTHPGASWTFNRASVKSIEVDNNRTFGDTNTI